MTKITGRRLAALFLIVAAQAAARAAPQAPTADDHRIPEYEASSVFTSKIGPFDRMADFTERWQYGKLLDSRTLLAGAYWRAERHLKLGAFYELGYGERHDDDWVRDPSGLWAWRDTNRRPEHSLVLDATPRAELSFLPGHWVGSLKLRFKRNATADKDVAQIGPELAWFWMNGLTPRATIFLRAEGDLALNFGGKTLWQKWYYLAGLWHATPDISLGPSIALRDETWSTSSSFQSFTGNKSYSVLYRAWVAGFTFVARLR